MSAACNILQRVISSVQHIGGADEGFFCSYLEANAGQIIQNTMHHTRQSLAITALLSKLTPTVMDP